MPSATFGAPLVTAGLPGFPDSLGSIAEARACVEGARLPARRSQPVWVAAHQALVQAEASRLPAHVAAARIALTLAIATEQHGSPAVHLKAAARAA